jgi:hypothetical protein
MSDITYSFAWYLNEDSSRKSWVQGDEKMTSKGYPKRCYRCKEMIWMQICWDSSWKPFDYPSETSTGNWDLHTCKGNV